MSARRRRVPAGTTPTPELYRATSMWQFPVLALDGISDDVTETVRLRAASHHDCHT